MPIPTEQLVIDDFTPGIFSDYSTGTVGFIHGKNGAATPLNTYRCHADPSGALAPLPKATPGNSIAISANQSAAYFPVNQNCYYILDANIMGPTPQFAITPSWDSENSRRYSASENSYITFLAFGFFNAPFGDGATGYYWHNMTRMFIRDEGGLESTQDVFYDNNSTGSTSAQLPPSHFPRDIQAGGLANVRATNNAVISFSSLFASLAGIYSNAFNHGTATAIIAPDATVTTFDTDTTTSAGNYATSSFDNSGFHRFGGGCSYYYPDPAAPIGSTFWVNTTSTRPLEPILILTHQDRVVIIDRDSMSLGNSLIIRDAVAYTAVDDPKALAALSRPFKTEYGSENVSGIGVAASISADTLLLVKNTGGGYIVQGDLNNPTVQKLPFIESTYNVASYPAQTPFGLFYGTRNGVFLWNGGQTSEKVSNQIDGMFWDVRRPNFAKYQGSMGRFAWWHPWVMVPNNYLMDTRTKAWWILDDAIINPPAGNSDLFQYHRMVFQTYVVNPANGKLHAFLNLVTRPQATFEYIFDNNILARSYSWQSHPIAETRQRLRSFQNITLMASGFSGQQVVVTLTGIDEKGTELVPVTETFNFSNNGRPVIMKHNLKTNFVAMDVQIRLQVTHTPDIGYPAAKIHSVALGTRDSHQPRVDR